MFSPHPDDETFGCGGTIAKRLSEGYEVYVVLMTDGRHSHPKSSEANGNTTPQELKKIRKAEERRAMRILGLSEENLIFLDFEDGTLEQYEDEAEKEIIKILMKLLPTEVYSVHEGDFHPDHQATSRIVKNAINKVRACTTPYEYSICPRYGRLGLLVAQSLTLVRNNVYRIDIADFLPLKEKAINEFKSQISVLWKEPRTPFIINLKRFMKDKETFFICQRRKDDFNS